MKNSEFITDRVPITKEEVRAICLSKLDIYNAKQFLDIGSGTGSVTVEAAIKNCGLNVYSIEVDDRAYELTEKNIEKFNLKNVTQIKDIAPVDFCFDKRFDSIFVGGSKNNLEEIIEWSYGIMNDGGKIVLTFILIENLYRCIESLNNSMFREIEVSQVSVSKMEKLGKGHYFKPENPIFIVSAIK